MHAGVPVEMHNARPPREKKKGGYTLGDIEHTAVQ